MLISLFTIHYSLFAAYADKVYIDITSHGIKPLPVAIQQFTGGKEISDIIKADLNWTGLFDCIEDVAQIEKPEDVFNLNNWKGLGVELVVKGRVSRDKGLTAAIHVFDAASGKEVLKKEYSATNELLRPLAHSISNDIYKILTGQQGIFRTRMAFVGDSGEGKELFLMDWDGHRIVSTGKKGGIMLKPHWSSDSSKILYSAERNRNWDVFLFDTQTMTEKRVVMLKGLNMSGNFLTGNKEFVFSSSKGGKSDIYIADTTTMKGRELISSPWIDVSPSVSPDGRQILFVSNRAGSPQVYVADINGSNVRRLTHNGHYNTSPVWSQKGDMIAFVGMIGGRNQIFIMKADGSEIIQLTNKGNNEDPSFS
ncbi:MAG: hypothetical protein L0Y62_04815, partial [Nitrospirae bacterium]|nr:hypothetical protein [Nitrospirota bacterium]